MADIPQYDSDVTLDERQIALPTLYGAPAYARPPTVAPRRERPFDPDGLPIEAHQSDDERDFTSTLPARAYAPGGIDLGRLASSASDGRYGARPESFSLRAIAGRLFGRT